MKQKPLVQIIAVLLASALLFGGMTFLLTRSQLLIGVNIPKEKEPYEAPVEYPPDITLLFTFEDGYGVAMSLHFANGFLSAVILESPDSETAAVYGYFIDRTVHCSFTFLQTFIDTLDGLTLTVTGEPLRYTGVQVCDYLLSNKDNIAVKCAVLSAVFDKIHQNGFSNETLSCIINHTKTDLCRPDCYGWTEYVGPLCSGYNIVNEG